MQPQQLNLPIPVESNPTILGCPITSIYFDHHSQQRIEVVGGRYAGSEYIYLAHLDRLLHRVQHYLGSTNDLHRRKQQHQRKYPSFRFHDLLYSDGFGIDRQILEALKPLRGKSFKRYHTLDAALHKYLGPQASLYKFRIMSAIKQHNTNGILMAANRCDIPWRIVRVFRADRKLERTLKKRKLSFRLICPACQGIEEPF
jgi:hypothetical protein